jgi:apolipoprotein N-acyltransferase
MIAATAGKLGALEGWRRLGLAYLAGFIVILAFPPFSFVPVLWISFPALMWMLDGCASRRAAISVGWAFGFGHFTTSLYWIANAFYVDRETFGALAVPAIGALCAALGLFMAVIAALQSIIPPPGEDDMPDDRTANMAPRIVMFAAAWTVLEWTRAWIFTGFPWNPMAEVWSELNTPFGLPMIQITTLIGTYGLTFITVLVACLPAVLGHTPRLRRAWLTAAAAPLILIVVGAGGALRLSLTETTFVPGVKLRLVQAAIQQADRARPSLWEAQLEDYVQLSLKGRPDDITHVIWGEGAVPPGFFLNLDEGHRRAAGAAAPANGLLITGADRAFRDADGEPHFYNSLYVLTPAGEIAGLYDKTHLVPFGEYMPLRWLVPYDKITGGTGDYSAGTGLKLFQVGSLPPFTPLICYEVIFSGEVTAKSDSARSRWLLNLTNDTWFGLSAGPPQHFAMARLRAVEEGLPLVRAANTGISGVIDGTGHTIAFLGLGARGVVDVALPAPSVAATPFALLGNFIPLLLATLAGAGAFLVRLRTTRSPS